jgi:predicted nucleic acid-binding protein
MKSLLDSTIMIDLLLNRPEAVNWFNQINVKEIAVCPINYAEVLSGCSLQEDWDSAMELLNSMKLLTIELEDYISAAKVRQMYRLKLPDALLVSLVQKHHLTLLTRNTKDFNPSIHKFVRIPYKLR